MAFFNDIHSDNIDGVAFTDTQQIQTAFNTLAGMLGGVASDGAVNTYEANLVLEFIDARPIFLFAPFNEFRNLFIECIEDGVIDDQEMKDMLSFCMIASDDNDFYDHVALKTQQLHGVMSGIAADGVIKTIEAEYLQRWMKTNSDLVEIWPFNAINKKLTDYLEDGVIDERESNEFIKYINAWTPSKGKVSSIDAKELDTIDDVINNVEISFANRTFCFTGKFENYKRAELQEMVIERGGSHKSGATKEVNYLVVGTQGNPCFKFSVYGVKVQQFMKYKDEGLDAHVIGELDFLEAIK